MARCLRRQLRLSQNLTPFGVETPVIQIDFRPHHSCLPAPYSTDLLYPSDRIFSYLSDEVKCELEPPLTPRNPGRRRPKRPPPPDGTARTGQVSRSSINGQLDLRVASVELCREISPSLSNQSLFITKRTSLLITDCHLFIRTHVLWALYGSNPALIIIRWNFLGFFHFFSCADLSLLLIQASRSLNRYLNF